MCTKNYQHVSSKSRAKVLRVIVHKAEKDLLFGLYYQKRQIWSFKTDRKQSKRKTINRKTHRLETSRGFTGHQ